MTSPEDPQQKRIVDLEIKISFLEKQVEDLDELVRELGNELKTVRRQCEALQGRLGRSDESDDDEGASEEPGFLA